MEEDILSMNEQIIKYPVQHPLLRKHIKFFWEIRADYMQLDHQVIPVRNMDVKFNLSETPHYLQINEKIRSGSRRAWFDFDDIHS